MQTYRLIAQQVQVQVQVYLTYTKYYVHKVKLILQ